MVEKLFHKLPRRAVRSACGILAVVAAPLVSGPALASPSARLVYARAPEAETCPDEEAVRAAVAMRLGYDPFFPWAPNTVLVDVRRSENRFRADVKLIDEHGLVRGVRHLETKGSECADLMAAMALTISLVVDPLRLTSPPPPPEPANPGPVPTTEPPPDAAPTPIVTTLTPSPPPPSSPRREPMDVYAGAGVLASLGTAPAPSFGGNVLVGARRQVFSLDVDARGELPASRQLTVGTVGSERLMGSLIPCVHLGVSLFCVVGSLAWVHASGSGLMSDRSGSAAAGALGARAGIELKLGPILRLRGYADLLAELFAPQLQIGGVDVYTLSPISGDIGLAADGIMVGSLRSKTKNAVRFPFSELK